MKKDIDVNIYNVIASLYKNIINKSELSKVKHKMYKITNILSNVIGKMINLNIAEPENKHICKFNFITELNENVTVDIFYNNSNKLYCKCSTDHSGSDVSKTEHVKTIISSFINNYIKSYTNNNPKKRRIQHNQDIYKLIKYIDII